MGVVFRREGDLKLSLFADADCADRYNDRWSVSGVAVMLGNTAGSASSTTQPCATLLCCNGSWSMDCFDLAIKGGVGFWLATSQW